MISSILIYCNAFEQLLEMIKEDISFYIETSD